MDIAKSGTFKNFIILNKALLFLINGITKFGMFYLCNISLLVLLKFDMSSWSTSNLTFKNFKRPIWHGLLNAAHQFLSSIIDYIDLTNRYNLFRFCS